MKVIAARFVIEGPRAGQNAIIGTPVQADTAHKVERFVEHEGLVIDVHNYPALEGAIGDVVEGVRSRGDDETDWTGYRVIVENMDTGKIEYETEMDNF